MCNLEGESFLSGGDESEMYAAMEELFDQVIEKMVIIW